MIIRAKAYAKINLFLDVVGKREDGYHLLDTVMQSVGIYDEIKLCENDVDTVRVFCDHADLAGETNIVHKAANAFFAFSNRHIGVDISIRKHIPIAAGTGGGSADAAAVLLMLNRLSGRNYPLEILERIALPLGADLPFCLRGGTARAGGIGEKLETLPTPKLYYVLLKNREKQSTGVMYARLDAADRDRKADIAGMLRAIRTGDRQAVVGSFYNAFQVCWDFEEMIKPFLTFSPDGVFLSGSGPTVCAAFLSRTAARSCADALCRQGQQAFFAPGMERGVSIE